MTEEPKEVIGEPVQEPTAEEKARFELQKRVQVVGQQIQKLLNENGLELITDHVIRLVPRAKGE